ncbi:calcium-binding protein, partial [Endozoicomonas sp. SESOKO2]|uniref:calcium-binding protein n=1 Tax=Endozoicomonas sp. SESOKO2 TaxID=2828743 RepID=UPI00214913CD
MLALLNRYPEKPVGEFPRAKWRKEAELASLANEGKTLGAGLHRIGSQESNNIRLVIELGFTSSICTPQSGFLRRLTLELGQQRVLLEGATQLMKKYGIGFLRPWHTMALKLVQTDADGRRQQHSDQKLFGLGHRELLKSSPSLQLNAPLLKWSDPYTWSELFPGQPMSETLDMLEMDYTFDKPFRDKCGISAAYNSSVIMPTVHLDLSSGRHSGIPVIIGGPGNDQLTGNPSADNVLRGMGGDDRLRDMGGNNIFIVGLGNSTVITDEKGHNLLIHDNLGSVYGTRLLKRRSRGLSVKVTLSTYQLDGMTVNVTEGIVQTRWRNTSETGSWRYHQTVFNAIDQIAGTPGDDTYFGSNGTDIFSTGGGLDKVSMGDGDDRVIINALWQTGTSLDGGNGANTLLFQLPVSRDVKVDLKHSLTVNNFVLEDTGYGRIRLSGDDKDNIYVSRGSLRNFNGRGGDDTLFMLKLPAFTHLNGGPGKDTLDLSRAVTAPELVRLNLFVDRDSVRLSCPAKNVTPCSPDTNSKGRLFYTLRSTGSRNTYDTWASIFRNFEIINGPETSDIFNIPAQAGLAVNGGGGNDRFNIYATSIKGNSNRTSITTTIGGPGHNRHYGSRKADRMVANLGPDLLSGN